MLRSGVLGLRYRQFTLLEAASPSCSRCAGAHGRPTIAGAFQAPTSSPELGQSLNPPHPAGCAAASRDPRCSGCDQYTRSTNHMCGLRPGVGNMSPPPGSLPWPQARLGELPGAPTEPLCPGHITCCWVPGRASYRLLEGGREEKRREEREGKGKGRGKEGRGRWLAGTV